jgi:hypothetical protein
MNGNAIMPDPVSGAVVGSAAIGAYSANRAAGAQKDAAEAGAAAQERMFNKQVALQEPFRKVGVNALPELVQAAKYKPFNYNLYQDDPGVGFRIKTGIDAADRTAAARGGLLGGNQFRGAVQYGQELGSQEYNNAFNRYLTEDNLKYNRLASLTGMGQTASNQMSTDAGTYGNNVAQNAATMGNIRASSYANTANAVSGGIGQGLNYYQNQNMLNRFFPQQQASASGNYGPGFQSDFAYQNMG